MKKFFKITGYVLLSVIIVLYLAFLFVIPHTINLNNYKSQIQQLVKDNTNLIVDFDKVDVITGPLLDAGVKATNLKVKLPDDSVLFSTDTFKGRSDHQSRQQRWAWSDRRNHLVYQLRTVYRFG